MAKNNEIDKEQINLLKGLFKVGFQPKAKDVKDQIFPLDVEKNDKGEFTKITKETFPPYINELYDHFWKRYNIDVEVTNFRRLCEDMDELYLSDALNASATNLIADEVVQADTHMQPIFVESSKKQKDDILQFFDDINIYPLIHPTAFNIVKHGNMGWALGMGKKGVTEIIPLDAFEFEGRLEFTPNEVEKEMKSSTQFKRYVQLERVRELVDSMKNGDATISKFKKYLLGFQIDGIALPPWRFLHFRNYVMDPAFKKIGMGMPLYIHALAPFRKWDAAMTFQVMARAMNFPKEKHTLSVPNVTDPVEKFNRVRALINNLDNLGVRQTSKEEGMLGDRVFCIEGAYDFEIVSPGIDLGKMDEADSLAEERKIATRLPRFIIDESDGGFGEGGTTLVQKWKQFARLIFRIQSIILENVTQLVKIHLLLTGDYSMDDIDFTLSMPFPESKNEEVIDTQNNLIELFNNICDSLSDRFLGGDPLPTEVVVSVLTQMNLFDQKVMDNWVKDIKKVQQSDEEMEESKKSYKNWKKLVESKGKRVVMKEAKELIFEIKQQHLKEGLMKSNHYYSSRNKYKDFNANLLREFQVKKTKKLQEGKGSKNSKDFNYNEESKLTKYKFISGNKKKGKENGKK